ncbi:MAG TPA: hypothetical protein VHX59_20010 [Mycobacteriales bacterium]|nr:hypothetical protein [Mycobacteriales bacterium]
MTDTRTDHGLRAGRGPDHLYLTPPQWDVGRPRPAFRSLADAGAIKARVLDLGCGTGEHRLMVASLGGGWPSGHRVSRKESTDPDGIRAWLVTAPRVRAIAC